MGLLLEGAVVLGAGIQDPLHRAVLGIADLDGPATGRVEAPGPVLLGQAHHPLGLAQAVEGVHLE